MFFKRKGTSENDDPESDHVNSAETGPLPPEIIKLAQTAMGRDQPSGDTSEAESERELMPTLRLESQAFSSLLDLTPAPDWSRKTGIFEDVPKGAAANPDSGFDWRVELKTPLNTEPPIRLHILGDVVLGRTSLADVELDQFGASDKGVSRRHALLRPTSQQLYLIELGSTNGTLLNGLPVGPGMARPLRSEDVITLGDLRLTVRLYGSPTKHENVSVLDMYMPDVLDKPESENRPKPES